MWESDIPFARTKICMQEQAVRRSRNYKFARRYLVSSEYFKNRPFGRFFDFVGKEARLRGEIDVCLSIKKSKKQGIFFKMFC